MMTADTKVNNTSPHAGEVTRGERFEFGKNWSRFLDVLDDERIRESEASLKRMLEVEGLAGKSFLDIGSGSGLFSLAARPARAVRRRGERARRSEVNPALTPDLESRGLRPLVDWLRAKQSGDESLARHR